MTKAQLQKIMKRNSILFFEVEDAINFVSDLLEFQANEIEEAEPYATNTIRRLRESAHEVWELQNYVEDVIEEE